MLNQKKEIKTTRKKGKTARNVLLAIGICIILLIGIFFWYSNHLLDKIQYASEDEVAQGTLSDEARAALEEPDEVEPDISTDLSDIENLEDQLLLNLEEESTDIVYDDNVLNILLVGTDSRTADSWSRSDTMIILSINKNTQKVVLTSLMRDIYLYIPDYGYNRINTAYVYGGPDLLLETVRENFKIDIDHYITVNFYSFIDIVDILGGITVDVSEAEMKNMNRIIQSINDYTGPSRDDSKLTTAGEQLLNGKQTLAYARVRYVGNADFERTERQREVINKMLEKAKQMSLFQLNNTLNILLPEIQTNFSKGEMLSLMLDALEYKNYKIAENRIPINGAYSNMNIRGMAVLGIDIDENIDAMNDAIYQ